MGSGSSSQGQSQSQTTPTGFLNPATAVLLQAFGLPVGTKGGEFRLGGGSPVNLASQSIDPNAFDELGGFLGLTNPFQDFAGEVGAIGDPNELAGLLGDVQLSGLGAADELATTGFKTDIQPIVEAENRRFFQETVPGLQQQQIGLKEGVGPLDTDLSAQLLRAGTDLGTNLGALEFSAAESAADRRAGGLPFIPDVTRALGNLGPATGASALNLGESFLDLGTPEGRLVTNLERMLGFLPSGPTARGQFAQGSDESSRVGVLK